MSMRPKPIGVVPEDTARVARAAFPKGNLYMQMRNVFGSIYEDEDFSELFEVRGRPAIAPWRLALVTVMQFSEGLSDRQAAEAVRARIDWKYALGLQLSDPGLNFSVLSEFRSRLVEGGKERLLLEKLLEGCKERGYLKVRGKARTDSTHVLGALRLLSKWERTAETMRSALNALASVDPGWLREHAAPEWFERYGRRIEDQRLPKGKEARKEYLKTVGADGMQLLEQLDAPHTPQVFKELAEVEILRQIWEQYYDMSDAEIRVLNPKEMPEGARRIESPYEIEARYSTKRAMSWVGYKVHLTESCDEGLPHLITDVHTTAATATDVKQLASIQRRFAASGMLPAEQLADSSYVCGSNLVSSHLRQIDLIGPAFKDNTWQAKAGEGFDVANFRIDWDNKTVSCPQERQSTRGLRRLSPRGSRSTSTSTSVPTTMGRGPRLPRPSCAQTFVCADLRMHLRPRPHSHRSITGVLASVLCGRFGPGAWIFALHLGAVATWPASVCGWVSEARISVEATPRPQADEDLARTSLELLLELHRIVASVEDEQRSGPLLLCLALMREAHKCFDLLSSHLVGVLRRAEALHVHGGNPALTNEIELCDELVGPTRYDRLPR